MPGAAGASIPILDCPVPPVLTQLLTAARNRTEFFFLSRPTQLGEGPALSSSLSSSPFLNLWKIKLEMEKGGEARLISEMEKHLGSHSEGCGFWVVPNSELSFPFKCPSACFLVVIQSS